VVADRYKGFLTDTAELQETRRQRIRTLRDYERKLERFGSIAAEEEQERNVLEAEDLAQQLAAMQREVRRGSYVQTKVSDVVSHLDLLVDHAASARTKDPKLDTLVDIIGQIRKSEPHCNILVYTEYIDSQAVVVRALGEARVGPVVTMNGNDDEKTRLKTTEKFTSSDNLILVSTDSAAEGLNLHYRCHHLIHLELPFNPNRLEQRNGRIDRYGQTLEPHVRYLFLRGTFEERILLRLVAKYEKQRARLTFVPNTLGISAATEVSQERLLRGLLEEDTKLFRTETSLTNLIEESESAGADEATKELLEEIDRSLNGFREAARSHAWLGDAGLNAEEQLLDEAEKACQKGVRVECVDLARFVSNAVRLDGGDLIGEVEERHFALRLPPDWIHGLDGLPGYDPEQRRLRLTTRLDVTSDESDNTLGYLGRAHPVVRRALDRVRNLSFGGASTRGQDPRVSAVKGAVKEATMLCTFLGRVSSRVGRELERVLAVLVASSGRIEFYDSADRWLRITYTSEAIRTTDVWKNYFENWGADALMKARDLAVQNFLPIALGFMQEKRQDLSRERGNQDEWLKKRTEEITGAPTVVLAVQQNLFDTQPRAVDSTPTAAWQSIVDPAQRLTAFHADRAQTPAARSEAEGVLRIYQQRIDHLDRVADLRDPDVIPLGVLMILPGS
jgi:hypothetical protein